MVKPAHLLRLMTAATFATCALLVSASALSVGTVQADGLRLRAEASTESKVLDTANKGEGVVILENLGNNWYKVDYKSVEGYMSGDFLTVADKADVVIGYGKVDTDGATLNMRSAPSTEAQKVDVLPGDAVVKIVGVDHDWYKVEFEGKTGYVSSEYLKTVKDDLGSRGNGGSRSSSSVGSQVASYAKNFLGAPYVWGGNGPRSFDCSGYVKYVYAHFGVTLNRTATAQLSNGVAVSRSQLQPGDLVFFRYRTSKPVSHVGIYLGGGKFIHASSSGGKVQINDMSSGHYSNTYVYGRHIL